MTYSRRGKGSVVGGILVVAVVAALAVVETLGDRTPGPSPHRLPASIPADCSRPVQAEIARFLAAVPDGGTVEFAKGGCYAQADTISVDDRRGLVIDGNGSTFRAVGDDVSLCRPNWRVQGGADIVLKNMTVYGRNNGQWDGPRVPMIVGQCEHGFTFASAQGGALLDSKAINVYGDPVSIEPDVRKQDYCAVPPNRDIVVDRFEGINAGRTVAITDGEGITIRNSRFVDMYDAAIDVEPDLACEYVKDIHITNNRFGRYRFALLNVYSSAVPSDRSGNLEFANNVTDEDPTTCYPPVLFTPGASSSPDSFFAGVIITGNRLRTLGQGVMLDGVRNSRVEGNTISKDYGSGCADPSVGARFFGLFLGDARNVNVFDNTLVNGPRGGFDGDVFGDDRSAGITRNPPR
jgi:hypothetical protein